MFFYINFFICFVFCFDALSQKFTLEDFYDTVFLVHAQRYPIGDEIRPQAVVYDSGGNAVDIPYEAIPQKRPTLHHAMNMLVPPHENGNWEGMAYVLVEPARAYKGTIYGGTAFDIFTVGPHRPSSEAVVIAPQIEIETLKAKALKYKGSYYGYPPSMTPREAVENVLSGLGAFSVSVPKQDVLVGSPKRPIQGPYSIEYRLKLRQQGESVNLNAPSYFPDLVYGRHDTSIFGNMEEDMKALVLTFAHPFVDNMQELPIIPSPLHELKFIEESWASFMYHIREKKSRFDMSTDQYLIEWINDLHSWFLLVQEDAELRLHHSRSIFQDGGLLNEILGERPKARDKMGKQGKAILSSGLRARVLATSSYQYPLGTSEINGGYLKLLMSLPGADLMSYHLRGPRDFVTSLLKKVEAFTGDKEFMLFCFLWRACRFDLLSKEEHFSSCVRAEVLYNEGVTIRDKKPYFSLFSAWYHLTHRISSIPGSLGLYDLLNLPGVRTVFSKILGLQTDNEGKIPLGVAGQAASKYPHEFYKTGPLSAFYE